MEPSDKALKASRDLGKAMAEITFENMLTIRNHAKETGESVTIERAIELAKRGMGLVIEEYFSDQRIVDALKAKFPNWPN